jgi:hypothetical protein
MVGDRRMAPAKIGRVDFDTKSPAQSRDLRSIGSQNSARYK